MLYFWLCLRFCTHERIVILPDKSGDRLKTKVYKTNVEMGLRPQYCWLLLQLLPLFSHFRPLNCCSRRFTGGMPFLKINQHCVKAVKRYSRTCNPVTNAWCDCINRDAAECANQQTSIKGELRSPFNWQKLRPLLMKAVRDQRHHLLARFTNATIKWMNTE